MSTPSSFRVIVADPPWEFGDKLDKMKAGTARSAASNYPTLDLAALKALPIDLLADEVLRLRTELADAQRQVGVWRDTVETQKKMRLDLAAEQDKLVAALDEAQNQLAAERKKRPDLKAELAAACAERAKEVVHNRELKAEVERLKGLVRARGLTIALFEKIVLGHADPGAVLRDAETGETAHIAPDVRVALRRLVTHARPESHKPIDRDRVRLALLDFELTNYDYNADEINLLADHLVKRLA